MYIFVYFYTVYILTINVENNCNFDARPSSLINTFIMGASWINTIIIINFCQFPIQYPSKFNRNIIRLSLGNRDTTYQLQIYKLATRNKGFPRDDIQTSGHREDRFSFCNRGRTQTKRSLFLLHVYSLIVKGGRN
jgi:hypothetical protein